MTPAMMMDEGGRPVLIDRDTGMPLSAPEGQGRVVGTNTRLVAEGNLVSQALNPRTGKMEDLYRIPGQTDTFFADQLGDLINNGGAELDVNDPNQKGAGGWISQHGGEALTAAGMLAVGGAGLWAPGAMGAGGLSSLSGLSDPGLYAEMGNFGGTMGAPGAATAGGAAGGAVAPSVGGGLSAGGSGFSSLAGGTGLTMPAGGVTGLGTLSTPALGFNLTAPAAAAFDSGIGVSGLSGMTASQLAAASTAAATGAGLTSGTMGATGSFLGAGAGGLPGPTTLSSTLAGAGGAAAPAVGAAGAGGAAASSALSKVLAGTATASDWAQLAGQALPGVLGAYGLDQQSGALKDLAGQYMGFGAPSRGRYEASMTPGFDAYSSIPGYKSAVDDASNSQMRALSTQGNPFGNPGGLIEAQKKVVSGTALPAIQNYQNQNAAAGGLSQLAGAVPGISQQAIGSQSGMLSSLGAAAGNVLNPQQQNPWASMGAGSMADMLKAYAAQQSKTSGYTGSPP